jgi:hypothetical protein
VSEQLGLLGDSVPLEPPPRLGDRQQLVLAALRAHPDGLDGDEVGALVHEHRGKHPRDQRCDWCKREGGEVLRSLRRHGLARTPRRGRWVAADAEQTPETPAGTVSHHVPGDPFEGLY